MNLEKLDDYQSWRVKSGAHELLIDPWLTKTLRFPLRAFLREREVAIDAGTPTALIITAPFGDHLHAESLAQLDRKLPVFTTSPAARRVRKLGFSDVSVVRSGETHVFDAQLKVTFVAPGFPYAHNSLGLLFEEPGPRRVYLETHVIGKKTLAALPKPIDAVVSTMESVRLFGIQLSMDAARAAKAAGSLQARKFIPTGVDPGRSTGILPSLLHVVSNKEAFERELRAHAPHTEGTFLAPGSAVTI